jgi:hypothetical protein
VQGLPSFYQVSFHSEEYVKRTWSAFFDVRGFVAHGPLYRQELAILQRAGGTLSPVTRLVLDLPIAALDSPVIGSILDEFHLEVRGWAFYPRRDTPPRLNIWIDGEVVASCNAELLRPDVGAVFFAHENAQFPGFRTEVKVGHLEKGTHVLWLSTDDSCVPICTTYFVMRLNPLVRFYNRCERNAQQSSRTLRHFVTTIRIRLRLRTRLKKFLKMS